MKPRIYAPQPKWTPKITPFQIIVQEWESRGLITLCSSPDRYTWVNKPGDILLHEKDLLLDTTPKLPDYNLGLFCNEFPSSDEKNNRRWTYWPRTPIKMEKFHNENVSKFREPKFRYFRMSFAGKVENDVQFRNRFQTGINWAKYLDICYIVKGVSTPYPLTPEAYKVVMSKTKFGLCLPGYGPKCQREIECTATGAIPLITPGVCTEYFDEWKEGVNYLRIHKEDEIEDIINTYSADKLRDIQKTNYEWYQRNATIQGVFDTTMRIINDA